MIDFYEFSPFAPAVDEGTSYLIQGCAGDMPLHDLWFLDKLVNTHKKEGIVIYEIGAWTGMSTCLLGRVAKECNGTLATIDNFCGSNGVQSKVLAKINIRDVLEKNLKRFGVDGVVTILERHSDKCDDIPDNSIDFLFIDGDHRYTQFKKDIKNWYPKVKEGGVVSGHDCNGLKWNDDLIEEDAEILEGGACHHGVNKALVEEFGNRVGLFVKDKRLMSSIWVVNK